MTRVKLCGQPADCDVATINSLQPDYVGFILTSRFRRYVAPERVLEIRRELSEQIQVVGVCVDEPVEYVAELLNSGTIDIAQLHGQEDHTYIDRLRAISHGPIIKAFKLQKPEDIALVNASTADYVLLDSGTGTGQTFDWSLIHDISLPFFLAGGLNPENVAEAVRKINPFGVDVSSGIETDGHKDSKKMTAFVNAVRKGE